MDAAPDRRQAERAVALGMLAALGKAGDPSDRLVARLFLKAAVEFIGKEAALAEIELLGDI
ncbi:hypothetical protein GCM10028812_49420 [Ancylobacter sonchi]